jgi:hypothetical protein
MFFHLHLNSLCNLFKVEIFTFWLNMQCMSKDLTHSKLCFTENSHHLFVCWLVNTQTIWLPKWWQLWISSASMTWTEYIEKSGYKNIFQLHNLSHESWPQIASTSNLSNLCILLLQRLDLETFCFHHWVWQKKPDPDILAELAHLCNPSRDCYFSIQTSL